MRHHIAAAIVAITLLVACAGPGPMRPAPSIDNVILIVVDTLRADVVGCYGGSAHTPTMDRLAREGVRFAEARSHIPVTGPSHASLFTSRWPSEHGARCNAQILDDRFPTLAELLRGAGMPGAAFVSLGVLKGHFGFERGFDSYVDRFGAQWFRDAQDLNDDVLKWVAAAEAERAFLWVHYSDPHAPYAAPDRSYPRVRVMQGETELAELPANGRKHAVDLSVAAGEARLRFVPGEPPPEKGQLVTIEGGRLSVEGKVAAGPGMFPWFDDQVRNDFVTQLPGTLALRLDDPDAASARLRFELNLKLSPEETREAYLHEVAFVDRAMGEMLDALEAAGRLERSLVIVTSDHGEGLGDHDLVGHIEQLYDSLLSVPLILWAPGRLPAGTVVESPVGLVDLLPTVAGLVGCATPDGVRGRDLWDLMNGGEVEQAGLLAQTFRPEAQRDLEALVVDGFKLIRDPERSSHELFDLAGDPGEAEDVSEALLPTANRLGERLDALLAAVDGREGHMPELDEATRNRLRELGYLR